MGNTNTLVRDTVFVARHPIFDKHKTVRAYELLFHSGTENRPADADASTLDLIASSLLVIGLDELTGQKRGFINFTRNLLLQGTPDLLPSDLVTIEIAQNIPPDDEVLAACRKFKAAGYTIALDGFSLSGLDSPLLELADTVKVDFLATAPGDRARIAERLEQRNILALAKKVETIEDFDAGIATGYTYFQGYFFSKPVIHAGNRIMSSRLSQFRLLNEVYRPDVSYDELEGIIKQDVALTYHLLKYINSVWFALRYKVTGIKHALVVLGGSEIRRWAALMSLRGTSSDKPSELFLRSLTRARMCESLAPYAVMGAGASDLFLLGMFSVIDALLDMPMAEILPKLPLTAQVTQALLGQPGRFRAALDAVIAYENGDWGAFAAHATNLDMDTQIMPALFSESLRWANQAIGLLSTD
ncbi:MAG: HDOD domain-containing protein [Planctomycetota bacterium]|nr:HDOD domain-containing protein [Planctomycetota bacterium]